MRWLLFFAFFSGCVPAVPLRICWSDGMGRECETGEPLRWASELLPLTYNVVLEQPYLVEAVHAAAKIWNRCVGFTVLVVSPEGTVAVVPVAGEGAATSIRGATKPQTAVIRLGDVGDGLQAVAAMVHEFGHVLGLGHGRGVMYSPLIEIEERLFRLLPSDADCEYVRRMYQARVPPRGASAARS